MSRVKPPKNIEFNPIEESFDLVTGNNFSYESVPLDKTLTIYENMQMAVFGDFELVGEIRIDGSLILED